MMTDRQKYVITKRGKERSRGTIVEQGQIKKEDFKGRVFIQRHLYYTVTRRLDMDHTVLPANYTMPVFPS